MPNQHDSFQGNIKLVITLLAGLGILVSGCAPRPSAVQEGQTEIRGIEIHYRMMGSGKATFVLSGGPGDALETMLPFEALSDEYRLILYDQRAAGRSTGDADTATHTMDNFVEDLESLRLKLAPEKINIIGGSWGCMVAMHYAFKYPENVSALVLTSTMGVSADYLPVYRANIAANRTAEDSLAINEITGSEDITRRRPEAVEKFWRLYFRAYCYDPGYADSINLWYRDTTYEIVEGRYNRLREFFGSYDIRDSLKLITCPTLILYGDYDPTPFEYVQPIHEGIVGSKLVRFENAGHWLWVEAADRILPVIRDFLKE
ncbi:MAG TPA: alpha/beta hydrolase [Acidobacteriota bacterium]|nr:alpha/beta hydrolase [Acidobacteriota bacterium]